MKDILDQFPNKLRLGSSDLFAFTHDDALLFLDLLYNRRKYIVLGGDVYDESLHNICDTWYYMPQTPKNHIEESYQKAHDYIVSYKNNKTCMVYFVFTIEKAEIILPLKL